MSFVLSGEHSFWWPVTIRVPSDDGAFKEQKLRVRFLTLSQDEFNAAISDQQFADYELLARALKGWDGVAIHHAKPASPRLHRHRSPVARPRHIRHHTAHQCLRVLSNTLQNLQHRRRLIAR